MSDMWNTFPTPEFPAKVCSEIIPLHSFITHTMNTTNLLVPLVSLWIKNPSTAFIYCIPPAFFNHFLICFYICFWTLTHHFRLVDPSRETLEDGLSRELLEELGVSLSVSIEDHVSSCYAPPPSPSSPLPPLITHFYVKKIEEKQVKEIERAAASTASDHGLEVMSVGRFNCERLPWTVWSSLPVFSRFSEWSESRSTP